MAVHSYPRCPPFTSNTLELGKSSQTSSSLIFAPHTLPVLKPTCNSPQLLPMPTKMTMTFHLCCCSCAMHCQFLSHHPTQTLTHLSQYRKMISMHSPKPIGAFKPSIEHNPPTIISPMETDVINCPCHLAQPQPLQTLPAHQS